MFKVIKIGKLRKKPGSGLGQTMVEFSFCMIVAMILLLGIIKIFVWSGKDLAERRRIHEAVLVSDVDPVDQIRPVFYYPVRINAAVDSNLYKTNIGE